MYKRVKPGFVTHLEVRINDNLKQAGFGSGSVRKLKYVRFT